jgi:solute carrier family 6 (neurotransmitter transporter, glycine) member 5/9
MNGHGHDNPTFIGDSIYTIPGEHRRNITEFYPGKYVRNYPPPPAQFQIREDKRQPKEEEQKKTTKERDSWGKGIEFLLSCIAMSVGLGMNHGENLPR